MTDTITNTTTGKNRHEIEIELRDELTAAFRNFVTENAEKITKHIMAEYINRADLGMNFSIERTTSGNIVVEIQSSSDLQ